MLNFLKSNLSVNIMKKKTTKRAVRNPITGQVDYYTNTKTVGLRNVITGRIEKRISRKDAEKRGIAGRIYTLGDRTDDAKKKKKKGFWF